MNQPKPSRSTRVVQVIVVLLVLTALALWQWWAAKRRAGLHLVLGEAGASALVGKFRGSMLS